MAFFLDVIRSLVADHKQQRHIEEAVKRVLGASTMSTGDMTVLLKEEIPDIDSGNLWTVLTDMRESGLLVMDWAEDEETGVLFRTWRVA